MTLYCGIDLHSNNSVVSLIDDADQLVSEKRLDNHIKGDGAIKFQSMRKYGQQIIPPSPLIKA